MHFLSVLESIKIYIKIAPTCFVLRPSSWSLYMSLAKVTFDFDYIFIYILYFILRIIILYLNDVLNLTAYSTCICHKYLES
jgi:hypothetical protein